MRPLQINNENISVAMMSQLDQLQLKCFQLMYTAAAAAVVVMLISRTKWRKRRREQHEGQEYVMEVNFLSSADTGTLLRWEKVTVKKEAGEMGCQKRQMWSDHCCSPGRCTASATNACVVCKHFLWFLSSLFIRDWKLIHLESSQ